jgi:hypothetical protein
MDRYKPFAAIESVINFSSAARRDGNMDLAMESNMFDFAADCKGRSHGAVHNPIET